MLFSEMKLQPQIIEALTTSGYTTPTPIQEQVIEHALAGKNIVGQSQTGTGKTAAFVIPLLELVDGRVRRPQALILAPTRELASQIRDEVFKLSVGMRIRSTVVFGGTSFKKQREVIDQGPQIVIATPGRLIDLIDKGYLDLAQVKYFVLDECDRMLDMGFVEDIDYIWSKLPKVEQTLTFSATIPDEMARLLSKYVGTDYVNIKATEELTVAKIDHSFIEVETFDKFELLRTYISRFEGKKVIVFSRTKHETEHLARVLCDNGIAAGFLHGDMEQRQRTRALRAFKEDEMQVFVTTDVAARGLNMNNIDLVVNFHVPEDPEAYIHRIGRTGRAGAEGHAIMFVSPGEKMMMRNVEKRNKIILKQVDAAGNPVERIIEEGRGGFGGGRGRSGGGGYRGGRGRSGGGGGYGGGRSSGGGYQGGGRSSGGGYQGFNSDGGSSSSGGYQGGAPREGGYQGGGRSSGGGYQGGNSGGGYQGGAPREGGYQGGGRSSGGGYQGGGRSGGGYQGGRSGGRSGGDTGSAPGRYSSGGSPTGGTSGGDSCVFGS